VLVETRENSVRCPDESKGGEQLMDRLGKRERERERAKEGSEIGEVRGAGGVGAL
jgi:hypothetical protein